MVFDTLEKFFQEIDRVSKLIKKENKEIKNNYGDIVVWGTGIHGKVIYYYTSPKYYVDSNIKNINNTINECKVISPDEFFKNYKNEKVVIASEIYYEEIKKFILDNNIDNKNILSMEVLVEKIRDYDYINIILENKEKISFVYSMLEDEKSKQTFLSTIFHSVNMDKKVNEKIIDENREYFNNDVISYPGEYFVDGGAHTGEGSSIDYIELYKNTHKYKKIYAFEPLESTFNKLTKNLSLEPCDKIELYKIGLLDKKTVLKFTNVELSVGNSISQNGDISIDINSLDNVLKDKKIDFIKYDIEGSELKALDGAKNIILNNNPKMAICTYHHDIDNNYRTHYWEVPYKIYSINPKYKLYVRHHASSIYNTICYAIT